MSADQILVIDHGQVVQRGTHAALLVQGGLHRDLYERLRVLLSATAMADLQRIFTSFGDQAEILLNQTVQAILSALEAGLHTVFWIGAVTMLSSFLLIFAIPEISLDGDLKQ